MKAKNEFTMDIRMRAGLLSLSRYSGGELGRGFPAGRSVAKPPPLPSPARLSSPKSGVPGEGIRGLLGISLCVASVLFCSSIVSAQTGTLPNSNTILNTKHNLSASGPGTVKATTEQEICVFCHAPHNASPIQPLWNRNTPTNAYTVYSSPSITKLGINIGPPSGSSKLCLSCHDGTIALGSVLSRGQQITMAGGATTLPPGATNLGTDLSDDHPISFSYDAAATADPNIVPTNNLPKNIRLDYSKNMQCTTCHDAHSNANGNFLVMDNSSSQLCNSCHLAGTSYTDIAEHSQCSGCHQTHSAPSGAYLLIGQTVTDTCLICHSGGVPTDTATPTGTTSGTSSASVSASAVGSSNVPAAALSVSTKAMQKFSARATNVYPDFRKFSNHATRLVTSSKTKSAQQVTCGDCHEGHTMRTRGAGGPPVKSTLGRINGVNSSGAPVVRARVEYEVCFKCHAEQNMVVPVVSRKIVETNTRLQFASSAVSSHPVEVAGKNAFVPSLRPGLTPSSVIGCGDCHGSDSSKAAGGTGPNGPHGSNFAPLLLARYDTIDNTPESDSAYALCYMCHDRSSILSNRSFPTHRQHIVDKQTPCSVCHDAHGISSNKGTVMRNSHLINFDITVVRPDPITHKLEYNSTGIGHGMCSVSCHGVTHSNKAY
jgi:predicted CXXCH cytochrome family protein